MTAFQNFAFLQHQKLHRNIPETYKPDLQTFRSKNNNNKQ